MMAKSSSGTSLEVPWLRLHVSTTGSAKGTGSLSRTKIPHATQLGQPPLPKTKKQAPQSKETKTEPPQINNKTKTKLWVNTEVSLSVLFFSGSVSEM